MRNNFFVSYKYLITLNNTEISTKTIILIKIIILYTGTATLSAIMSGSFVFAFKKLIIKSHLKKQKYNEKIFLKIRNNCK
jgi:hypothetical protein